MPAPRQWNVDRLEIAAFARESAELRGQSPVGAFRRLNESQPEDARGAAEAAVRWQLAGAQAELAGSGRRLPVLTVRVQAPVVLQCQRCLQPLTFDLDIDRRLFFAEGEDAAAALDAESDDDVLALQPSTDALQIVEDELLLALPLIPRHDVCPEPLVAAGSDETGSTAHPFGALAALKSGLPEKPH